MISGHFLWMRWTWMVGSVLEPPESSTGDLDFIGLFGMSNMVSHTTPSIFSAYAWDVQSRERDLLYACRRLGFALHEMLEISAISFGAILNAKYVLSTAELITSRSTPRSMTFIGSWCVITTSTQIFLDCVVKGFIRRHEQIIFFNTWMIRSFQYRGIKLVI